jgi:predicted dehydrogenase
MALLTYGKAKGAMGTPQALRIGVIGCGQVAMKGALPGFSQPGSDAAGDAAPFLSFDGAHGVEIAAIADTLQDRLDAAAARFKVGATYLDGLELITEASLDGVVICTPPRFHQRYSCAALERGLSVLVEKPGATSSAELATLLDAIALYPAQSCLVNASWLYHPAVSVAASALAEGNIGKVRRAAAVFRHGGPQEWSPTAAWYREPELGGVVTDLGLHTLIVLENVLGGPTSFLKPSVSEQDPLERAQAEAVVGGFPAHIALGWDAVSPQFTVRVTGDDAELLLDLIPWSGTSDRPAARIRRAAAPDPMVLSVPRESTGGGPYRQFLACIRTGGPGLTDLTSVANALRHVLEWKSAVTSARLGQP